jgi:hypothetical protein
MHASQSIGEREARRTVSARMGVDDWNWLSEDSAEATIQQSKAAAIVTSKGMLEATTRNGGEKRMASGASRDQVNVPTPSA